MTHNSSLEADFSSDNDADPFVGSSEPALPVSVSDRSEVRLAGGGF